MRKWGFYLLIMLFAVLASNLNSLIAEGELLSLRIDILTFFSSLFSIQLAEWVHR